MSQGLNLKKPKSIALRLTFGLTLGTAILWLGAAIIAALVMQTELNETMDETIQKNAQLLLPIAMASQQSQQPIADDRHDFYDLLGEMPFIIKSASGELLFTNNKNQEDEKKDDITDILQAAPLGFSNNGKWRLFNYIDPLTSHNIIIAEDKHERDELLKESLTALILPLLALIPLIAIGIWFGVRLSMAPVDRLRKDIAKRDGHNLTSLNAQTHPKEFAPIAQEVENLMARLEAALQAERNFAASSAHELRTPLAGALAQTQLLMQEINDNKTLKRLKEIEHSLKHLSNLSEKLLQLTRLEAGFAKSDTIIDLMPIIYMVADEYKFNQQQFDRIDIKTLSDTGPKAAIHADAFFLALRNLVQNALIHSDANSKIYIYVDEANAIHVQNSGKVMSAQSIEKLKKPFIRGTTDAVGSGLGLSIVCSIMQQTDGHIVFNSPISGKKDGFEVILSWIV